ncbi:MAG: biotin--[acetyl-CoA-carboxylase] ligase [Chloroflexota bacterium]
MSVEQAMFGRCQINHFDEIDSTSNWLTTHRAELNDWTIAVADFQSAGRGRLGRTWVAPPGTALMMSILVRPNWSLDRSGWLMMIAGIAAAETLTHASGINIQLKWPNDLVFASRNGLQKVGGILSEAETANGKLAEAIVGIGLNINMTHEQLPPRAHTPAASLRTLSGKTFDRRQLQQDLLRRFQQLYDDASRGRSPLFGWRRLLVTLGQTVTSSKVGSDQDKVKIEGTATGVDEWGRLEITLADGTVQLIAAGDVTLRSPHDQ